MAISQKSQNSLSVALADAGSATEICDIIDAGTGTISANTQRRMQVALGRKAADDLFTIVNAADGAINAGTLDRLEIAVGFDAASDINAGIVANVD